MNTYDILRLLVLTIREHTADVSYSDDFKRLDIRGAFGDSPTADDLVALKRANSAIYAGWLAGMNERDKEKRERLEAKARKAEQNAAEIVRGWGKSPAGGRCELDARAVSDCGAVVVVCYDPHGVARRVDFSYYFGRA